METFVHSFNINTDICDEMIKYHQKNKEYKTSGSCVSSGKTVVDKNIKDSIDVTFYNSSKNKTIQKYFESLTKGLSEYINKFNLIGTYHTYDSHLIQYYPPNGGFKVWHDERGMGYINGNFIAQRGLVYMTYLNDVNDGGETEFLYQKIKFKPKKGLSLIWPTDFTHTHRGIPSKTQEKYITTGWFLLI